MKQANAMLGLLTHTSIHAGTGQATGVIDLPIQREAHTGWPCVFGSAVKGALRTRAVDRHDGADWISDVFGPPPPTGSAAGSSQPQDYGGALAVGDAKLLLLPIRSLTTHFKWVTCPALLRRWQRDLERNRLKSKFGSGWKAPEITGDVACVATDPPDKKLFLEEFRFDANSNGDLSALIASLATLLRGTPVPGQPDANQSALKAQLAVISDDRFSTLCRFATPVNPHVQLGGKKTVSEGPWYEETLPPDTVLYVELLAYPSRNNQGSMDASAIMKHATDDLFTENDSYLQLGGNETVGMGWCGVTVHKADASPIGG